MRVEYTGRHTEVPAAVRRLGDRKLRKLARLLPGITDVRVILTADKHRKGVEVTVHSRGLDLAATEQSDDFGLSLSTALEKLTRQATRHRDKLRVRKGGARAPVTLPRAVVAAAEAGPRPAGPRIIRARRLAVKPMTLEEAAREIGGSPDGVVVFRDAATERVSVLYRRKDGNLGLIEPEA